MKSREPLSSINPEYLRFEQIKNTNYSSEANIRELVRWLNYRMSFVQAITQLNWTSEEQELVQQSLKNIEDQLLEILNIKR